MEILLTRNNVNHLVEVILVMSLFRSTDISSEIQTRSITFLDEWFREFEFFEIDELSSLVFDEETFFYEDVVGVLD
jgi:hypothetical protein